MTYEEKMALCIRNKEKLRERERPHSVFIDTDSRTYILDGKILDDIRELSLHIGPDGRQISVTYYID